jgi:hypothetical protein
MTDLPWLVRAEGPGPERRQAERTEQAALDLAAVARRVEGHLVLHEAVDIAFAFEAHQLPPGSVDLRHGDALGHALADGSAVLVTAGGIWIGTPIERDPRWARLQELGPPHVVLGSSGLSGAYLGCTLHADEVRRFHGGVAERVVGVAARLVFEDGTVVVVERTTIGYRTSGADPVRRSRDLVSILTGVPGLPLRVTSELLDHDELLAVLAEAGKRPPRTLTVNGRRWI